MDLQLLKTEPESEFADQRISSVKSTVIYSHHEKRSDTARSQQLRSFLEQYCKLMLSLGIQSCRSEPFIVVECPVCPTVYKAKSDRLLHLLNHVEKRHKYKCEELVTALEVTYERLLQCMKIRLQKSSRDKVPL